MSGIIINDIISAFKQYVPYAITSGVIVIAAICIIHMLKSANSLLKNLNHNIRKLILYFLTYIYSFSVVFITFLSREPGTRDSLDLRLFSTFSRKFSDNIYPVENIILFIPLGLLLPMLWHKFRDARYCFVAGSLFSLIIETSQFVTKRGFCQIDDILTNTLGDMMGFGMFCIISLIFQQLKSIRGNKNYKINKREEKC